MFFAKMKCIIIVLYITTLANTKIRAEDTEMSTNKPQVQKSTETNSTNITTTIKNETLILNNGTLNITSGNGTVANTTDTNTTRVLPEVRLRSQNIYFQYSEEFCSCDLSVHLCDLNCCCDVDCSRDQLDVFSGCDRSGPGGRARVTSDSKRTYGELAPCAESPGLLCIQSANTPKDVRANTMVLPTEKDCLQIIESASKWSNPIKNVYEEPEFKIPAPGYKMGDGVWGFNTKTQEIGFIDVLGSSVSRKPNALIKTKYLINDELFYIQNINPTVNETDNAPSEELQDALTIDLKNIFDIAVVSNPKLLNSTSVDDCGNEICLKIDAYVCADQRMKTSACAQIFENEIEESCVTVEDESAHAQCFNLTKFMNVEVHHNYSQGITKIAVYFYLLETTPEFRETFELERVTRVRYLFDSSCATREMLLSGNPGYLLGKPVIVGRYDEIIRNISETKQEKLYVIDYFNEKSSIYNTKHVITYPKNVGSLCVLDNDTFEGVTFGRSLQSNCKVKISVDNATEMSNLTQICNNIQSDMYYYLLGEMQSHENIYRRKIYVSTFGNPKNLTAEWLEIQIKNIPDKEITGHMIKNKIYCRNIIYFISYDFAFAKIDFASVKSQARLIHVSLSLGEQSTISFDVNSRAAATVVISVMFHDVTSWRWRTDKRIANKYVFTDILYPFVRSKCLKVVFDINLIIYNIAVIYYLMH